MPTELRRTHGPPPLLRETSGECGGAVFPRPPRWPPPPPQSSRLVGEPGEAVSVRGPRVPGPRGVRSELSRDFLKLKCGCESACLCSALDAQLETRRGPARREALGSVISGPREPAWLLPALGTVACRGGEGAARR